MRVRVHFSCIPISNITLFRIVEVTRITKKVQERVKLKKFKSQLLTGDYNLTIRL